LREVNGTAARLFRWDLKNEAIAKAAASFLF
jgi:hypothetical protein